MKVGVREIREIFRYAQFDELSGLIEEYEKDNRNSIKKLVEKNKKWYNNEIQRLHNMLVYERKYENYEYICGCDEVGSGALAGPLVVAAVIMPKGELVPKINDSKKLSYWKRLDLYDIITENAVAISITTIENEQIDTVNVHNARLMAMGDAINKLSPAANFALIDGMWDPLNVDIDYEIIKAGDEKSLSIAAASIVAKVTRDEIMEKNHKKYPAYKFGKNKGYGTKEHIQAIKNKGICPLHRLTFIKKYI